MIKKETGDGMNAKIKEMKIEDYDEIFAMWQVTSKRALSKSDDKDEINRYLNRNKGMSQVAVIDGKIVGTVLAGHDGRRGFIHHMAVLPDYRRQGIARAMAQTAINKIKQDGIDKTHIFTYKDNNLGQAFWGSLGFVRRDDIYVYSFDHNM